MIQQTEPLFTCGGGLPGDHNGTRQTERDALIAGLIEVLKGPAMLTTQEATAIADAADVIEAQALRIAELEDRGADWEDAKITTLRAELDAIKAQGVRNE
jgi:hypothetical protein